MPKGNNHDSSNNNGQNSDSKFHQNRIRKFLEEQDMQFSESFDEFFKSGKQKISKEEWDKLVGGLQFKKAAAQPNLVIMVEEDYENLIEMRGLFKNTNRPEYVATINKILSTVNPPEKQ